MKRAGNLYQRICSIENLMLADNIAQRGKSFQPGVILHNLNMEADIIELNKTLLNKSYHTSPYTTFTVFELKERLIFRLPYYPDRIVHHAIMNILEPLLVSVFTKDTYNCIKHRGIHALLKNLKKSLNNREGTRFCLKLDITKFYPSVDHTILKVLIRKKIKDNDLLYLLDDIIDSADGLPIGNYLSQYFANLYLAYFDHWIKEELRVRYYFRYADDIVILAENKGYLHNLLNRIRIYFDERLKLAIKGNYQIFPVESRGIDFVGYVFRHSYILLRKRIKKHFAIMLKKNKNPQSVASYSGWAVHCNSRNLIKKLLNEQIQPV